MAQAGIVGEGEAGREGKAQGEDSPQMRGQGQVGAPSGCPRGCPHILGTSAKPPDMFGVTSEGQKRSDAPLTQLRVIQSFKGLEGDTFAQEICHF